MVQELPRFDGFDISSFIKDDEKSSRRVAVPAKLDQVKLVDRRNSCPECNSSAILYTDSSVICKNCGTVIEEGLPENRPGWRVFTEEDKIKIHAEKERIDRGLTTVIPIVNRDYAGSALSAEMAYKMRRLSKRDSQQKETNDERNLRDASNLIRVACSKLNLPDQARDQAIIFFKSYVKNDLEAYLKGKSIHDLSYTIVYKTCKDLHVPYTIEEIASTLSVNAKKLRGYYIEMMQHERESETTQSISSPSDYIPRFASMLDLDGSTTTIATKMMNDAMNAGAFKSISMGKERDGYAAAMLYIACLVRGVRPMRKRDVVARCTGVAESTIKKRAEELVELLDIDPEYYFEKNYKRYVERHKNRFKKG